MATCANGWPVLFERPRKFFIPGTEIPVWLRDGDVAVVLLEAARRYHLEVESLLLPGLKDEWSWYVKPIFGQTEGYSNHSGGCALDLNSVRHPYGVRNTYSSKQRAKLREIEEDLDGVIRWGEFYSGNVDGMHCEINDGERAVSLVADRIRAAQAAPDPLPTDSEEIDMFLAKTKDSDAVWLVGVEGRRLVDSTPLRDAYIACGVKGPFVVGAPLLNRHPDLGVEDAQQDQQSAALSRLQAAVEGVALQVSDDATAAQVADVRALVAKIPAPAK